MFLQKIDTIHPGVVVAGPTGSDRIYAVAMISKKLPGDPPQKPVSTYQSGTGMEGNISLVPVQVAWSKMKVWRQRDTGTGQQQPSLTQDMLVKLLNDIGECVRLNLFPYSWLIDVLFLLIIEIASGGGSSASRRR